MKTKKAEEQKSSPLIPRISAHSIKLKGSGIRKFLQIEEYLKSHTDTNLILSFSIHLSS
jgi:indole-3-glycerol phosphate synthase